MQQIYYMKKISDRSLLYSIMLFIIDELVKGINIRQVVVRMRSSLKVAMIAWSVSGSDVTRLSSLWCKLSHYYHRWFHGQHIVYWNAVKHNPIIVLFNYVSVFITCLFAWYWWRCEKEYNHCSLQLWRNCYTKKQWRRRSRTKLWNVDCFHGVWSVRYMNGICLSRTEKCQLILVGVLISKLRRFKWFGTVRYMKGN